MLPASVVVYSFVYEQGLTRELGFGASNRFRAQNVHVFFFGDNPEPGNIVAFGGRSVQICEVKYLCVNLTQYDIPESGNIVTFGGGV